jgi:hypothetical protein
MLGTVFQCWTKISHYRGLKELGRLKAEIEKVLNGEAVLKDGKTVWDDFFRRSVGSVFLQDLERAHAGVSIEIDHTRRKIRLFGVAEKRLKKIFEKLKQLRMQKSCFILKDRFLLRLSMANWRHCGRSLDMNILSWILEVTLSDFGGTRKCSM